MPCGGGLIANLRSQPHERLRIPIRSSELNDRPRELVRSRSGCIDLEVVERGELVDDEVLGARQVRESVASGELSSFENGQVASYTDEIGSESLEGSDVGTEAGRVVEDQVEDEVMTSVRERAKRRRKACLDCAGQFTPSDPHDGSSVVRVVDELDSGAGGRFHADVCRGQHRDHRVRTHVEQRSRPLRLERTRECGLAAAGSAIEKENHESSLAAAQRIGGSAAARSAACMGLAILEHGLAGRSKGDGCAPDSLAVRPCGE